MRAALILLLLLWAVPAAGAETDTTESGSEAAVETVSPPDEETLEIMQRRGLLELMELLEDMDVLIRMEEKE
jgi:hypothetical protein